MRVGGCSKALLLSSLVFLLSLCLKGFVFVKIFRILRPRESLEIERKGLRTKITQFWGIIKIGLFKISQGEILFSILQILFSPWEIENTIREFSNAIRFSAENLIAFSDKIRKNTSSRLVFTLKFIPQKSCFLLFFIDERVVESCNYVFYAHFGFF